MAIVKDIATKGNLRMFQEHITSTAESLGLPAHKVQHLELSCEEALVNIMNYAYSPDQGHVQVDCHESDGHVVVEIKDEGKAYDPLARPDPNTCLEMDDRPIGGLGVYFMKKFMDHVRYERKDGNNILTLKIRIEK